MHLLPVEIFGCHLIINAESSETVMRILVTGGAGFIGSNFLHYMRNRHPTDEITCLDLLTYAGHIESIRQLVEDGYVKFIKGDIRNRETVSSAMRDADAVVHLAAESHVDRSIKSAEPFVETNVKGTLCLLEEARRHDTMRFHHVSTDEVFGSLQLDSPERFTEKSCYNPRSPYAASKAASDHLVRAYSNTYGLNTTVSNCGNNFGPYQHPEKLIPRFVTLLLTGRKVPLYGSGLNVRDWVYVEDHCSAVDTVMRKGRSGETYLVSGGNEISNAALTGKILSIMGLADDMVERVADRPGHDLRYAIDDTKLRSELGWSPLHSLDASLEATISWYRNNTDWWRPIAVDTPPLY